MDKDENGRHVVLENSIVILYNFFSALNFICFFAMLYFF